MTNRQGDKNAKISLTSPGADAIKELSNVRKKKEVYKSIREAPNFPDGFVAVHNGFKKVNITNNEALLAELRDDVERGAWKKVYIDGYDREGNKKSIHCFISVSGLVYNLKVKNGWSNKGSRDRHEME
jgi:hypothetical protein